MSILSYRRDQLAFEAVSLAQLASIYGTPLYVYSKKAIVEAYKAFIAHKPYPKFAVFYAVKANSNLAILELLGSLGAGFDIVSQGELLRVIKAGGDPQKIVFSGVGKTEHELELALKYKISCINVESLAELELLHNICQQKQQSINIALRINPDIDAKSHPYISTGLQSNKFGLSLDDAQNIALRLKTMPELQLKSLSCHIGSQICDRGPFQEMLRAMLQIYHQFKALGFKIENLNLGGGLGISYLPEQSSLSTAQYLKLLQDPNWPEDLSLHLEPGRALVANAGILLSKSTYIKPHKHKQFLILDAGMNDLLRPALYQSSHTIQTLHKPKMPLQKYEVVGPVCESSDTFIADALLDVAQGDILAITQVGAYGFSMASSYNSRPRPAEVLVDANKYRLIRARETLESLYQDEKCIADIS